MPYCNKCGSNLNEDAKYCPSCGASVIRTERRLEIETSIRKKRVLNYTFHQTGAIATLLAVAVLSLTLWGINALFASIFLYSTPEMVFFAVLTVFSWLLVPLYWARDKWSYVIGIFVTLGALFGGAVLPGVEFLWQEFTGVLVYDVFLIISFLIGLASIYFSYKAPACQGNSRGRNS